MSKRNETANKENQNVEWKESWRDEYLKWICAFANSQGGLLIIGKNDKGDIIGVSDAERLLTDLPGKICDTMGIIADVNLLKEDAKETIEINVKAYTFPICYHGKYYYRSGSTTRELTGNALSEFILRRYGKTWDGVPVPNVSYDDFEKDAFKAFRKKAIGSAKLTDKDLDITDEVLLENLRLKDGDYLIRAAILLFHQTPDKWVFGSHIKIGYFENAADLLYQDEIYGPLITLADKVEDLVYLKYFKGIISYEGLQRIETYPVPRSAFREAVLNAIIHKDYSTGNPIHIHIYPDKVLIYNDGKLPENWTVDDLLKPHTSKPYNPLIASTFFRSGQIEAWGRGIEKIRDSCRQWKMPDPFYQIRSNEVMIGFNTESHSKELYGTKYGEKYGVNRTKEYGNKYDESTRINKTQREIILLMEENPDISAKDIAEKINMTINGVEKSISKLKKKGLIEHVGPAKGGHWIIK